MEILYNGTQCDLPPGRVTHNGRACAQRRRTNGVLRIRRCALHTSSEITVDLVYEIVISRWENMERELGSPSPLQWPGRGKSALRVARAPHFRRSRKNLSTALYMQIASRSLPAHPSAPAVLS